MSNLIKIDFRKEQRRDTDAYQSFDRGMYQRYQEQRLKVALVMVGFSLMLIGVASIPFIIDYLRTH